MPRLEFTSVVDDEGRILLPKGVGQEWAGRTVRIAVETLECDTPDACQTFVDETAGQWEGDFERPDQGSFATKSQT